MSASVNGRKVLNPCGCGCGRVYHWAQLHLLRDQSGRSYFVHDDCRDEFAKELAYWHKIKLIRDALRGDPCWKRWRAAKAWHALQFLAHARLKGAEEATRTARRDTLLFVLPRWMARLYAKTNQPKKP
jgi:hypothetical protein